MYLVIMDNDIVVRRETQILNDVLL